jgi:hypothetical protein
MGSSLLQQDMYQMKEEHDLSAVEMCSFSEKQLTAVKQEAQGDAEVSHSLESKVDLK